MNFTIYEFFSEFFYEFYEFMFGFVFIYEWKLLDEDVDCQEVH